MAITVVGVVGLVEGLHGVVDGGHADWEGNRPLSDAGIAVVEVSSLRGNWTMSRLIEQVTEHGWKDLFPLVENLLKWEFNRSGRENVIYGQHL